MEINNDNYIDFIHELKSRNYMDSDKYTNFISKCENDLILKDINLSNTCEFNVKCLESSEILKYVDCDMSYQTSTNIANYHSEFFTEVKSWISYDLFESGGIKVNFDSFQKNYEKLVGTFLSDVENNNTSLNAFNDNFYLLFDWLLLYHSTFYNSGSNESMELFKIILIKSKLYSSLLFEKFIFRNMNDSNSIINRICSSEKLFNIFIANYKRCNFWNIINGKHNTIIYLLIKTKIFHKLFPVSCELDFKDLLPIILNYRDNNNNNIFHILYNAYSNDIYTEYMRAVLTASSSYFKHYTSLLCIENDDGIFPYNYCKCMNYENINTLIDNNLLSYKYLFEFDRNTFPVIIDNEKFFEHDNIYSCLTNVNFDKFISCFSFLINNTNNISGNRINVVYNYIKKYICSLDNISNLLQEQIYYFNTKSYSLIMFLESIMFSEYVFEKCDKCDLLYIEIEKSIVKNNYVIPFELNEKYPNTLYCYTNTINKLIENKNITYVNEYFDNFINNAKIFNSYLPDIDKRYYLLSTIDDLLYSKLQIAESIYIIKILCELCNDKKISHPSITILKNHNIFIKVVKFSIEMFIIGKLSQNIGGYILNWEYDFNEESFTNTLNLYKLWPTHIIDITTNYQIVSLVEKIIDKNHNIPYNIIFGDDDELISTLTLYSNSSQYIYILLMNNNYAHNFFEEKYQELHNITSNKNTSLINLIFKFPNFKNNIFYYNAGGEDIFLSSYKQSDGEFMKYILENCKPSNEYNKIFMSYIHTTSIGCVSSEILILLFKYKILYFTSFDNIDNYIDLIDVIIDKNIFSIILEHLHNDFNNLIIIQSTSKILIKLINLNNDYYESILNDQFETNTELIDICKSTYSDEISKNISNSNIIKIFMNERIFKIQNIKYLLNFIVTSDNYDLFPTMLNKYDISEIISEELLYSIDVLSSFLLKIITIEENYRSFVIYCNDKSNNEMLENIIDIYNKYNISLLHELVSMSTSHHIYLLAPILLAHNRSLITDDMIYTLISLNKKSIIEQCIIENVKINNSGMNLILAKYPDIVLLCENINELIENIDDNKLHLLFNSHNITPELQDLLLCYILDTKSNDVLEKCAENIQIYSPFFDIHDDVIKNLIDKNNNIYYKLIKKNINIKKYLFMKDVNENYMFPYIPDGYVNDNVIEQFINKLTFDDLTSVDVFGRSVFINFMNTTFFKFILHKPDIDKLYLKNKKIIQTVLDEIILYDYNLFDNISIDIKTILTNIHDQNIPIILLQSNKQYDAYDYLKNLKNNNTNAFSTALNHIDNKGNNILFYSSLHLDVFNEIFDMYLEILGKKCLYHYNHSYETLFMFAIKNCIDNSCIDMLLENSNITTEQNYIYKNSGSILTYGSMYLSENIFDNLLNWTHIIKNQIDVTQYFEIYDWFSGLDPLTTKTKIKTSLLIVASYFNSVIFGKLLNLYDVNYITTILQKETILLENNKLTPVEFAYLYNPESFQYLTMFKNISSIELDHGFFSKHYKIQPLSWYYYVNSKLYINTISNIYTVQYMLRPAHLNSIKHIINSKQECASNVTELCTVCMIGKKKILFGCHKHLTCVSCGCILEKCPECRNMENDKKIKIFD